jgi:uncharacterized surface protein with fasciclin (FAS1) repeats
MIKNPFSILRQAAIIMLAASLFILGGCKNDDGDAKPTMTISEIIASSDYKQSASVSADVALDSTNKYINKYPELQALVTGSTEYTFFAPSNTAFISLTALPGLSNINLVNPDLIKGVLLYHFVATQKLKADLTAGTSLNSLYTDASTSAVQTIVVNTDGTLKTGSTNQSIVITKPDLKATNGVVHITGTVLIPPTVGASLTPILGTMAGTVLLGKDFTLLARLIARADAGYTEDAASGKLKVSSHLARPISSTFTGATFFAPPNAVFEAAATAAGITSTALVDSFTTGGDGTARAVILNHYVFGKYVVTETAGSTTLTNGATLVPLTQKSITVLTGTTVSAQNPYGVVLSNTPTVQASFLPIVSKDLAHSNGVIQVYGGILK